MEKLDTASLRDEIECRGLNHYESYSFGNHALKKLNPQTLNPEPWLYARPQTGFSAAVFGRLPRLLSLKAQRLLGGSWDLVSKDIGTLIGATSSYRYSYPIYNPSC